MIGYPGIPQYPFIVSRIIDSLDLLAHLLIPIINIILEIGGRKILQPRTHNRLGPVFLFGSFQQCHGILQGMPDSIIRLRVRICNTKITRTIMRRVNHWTDIVKMLRHILIFLAHGRRVLLTSHNGPEHIRRHK